MPTPTAREQEPSPGNSTARPGQTPSVEPRAWSRTAWVDRFALPIAVTLLLICTIPRLPPGVCFGDAGDLQAAAATLGIAHPPGYAGYVSLGFLLTWLPGVSPAYAVTLGCLAAGLAALALGALMQIRLGTNAWIAAALTLAIAGHPRLWVNLVVAEVYAPSLAFVAGGAYLLFKYVRLRYRRDLLLAALLVGVAFANRPPVGLALPAFGLALWLGGRRTGGKRPSLLRDIVLAAVCLLVPCLYSCGYLYVRDTAATPCNYIEHYNAEFGTLPPPDAGTHAKLQRLAWLTTGRQFRGLMARGSGGLPGRVHWLTNQLGLKHDAAFVIAAIAVAFGLVFTYRRCPACAILLAGIALAAAAFVCRYRVYDTAADVLPILFVGTVLVGVAVSPLFPTETGWWRRGVAVGIFLAACVWTVYDARGRPDPAAAADATAFVRTADVGTLPANAVVFSSWAESLPLRYAQHVLADRADIRIVTAGPSRWIALAQDYAGPPGRQPGPLYLTERIAVPPGYSLTPYRNLWRLESPSR